MQARAVPNPTLEALSKVGEAFGFGAPMRCERVTPQPSFHSVFKCEFSTTTCALKRLVLRPDLYRWRDRFEAAFQIEKWLAARWSFLPKPVSTRDGSAIADVFDSSRDRLDWYIAHQWIDGHTILTPAKVNFNSELGLVISRTAGVPLGLLKCRIGMDDPIPDIQDIIRRLGSLRPNIAVSRKRFRALEQVAPILESVVRDQERSSTRIAGHRDLSPQNVIANETGFRAVVDWENVGDSTLEAEIGRVIVQWTSDTPTVEDTLLLLKNASNSTLSEPGPWWFKSWLEGHLMFLNHLAATAVCSQPDNLRLKREVDGLVRFGQRMPHLVRVLKFACELHGTFETT